MEQGAQCNSKVQAGCNDIAKKSTSVALDDVFGDLNLSPVWQTVKDRDYRVSKILGRGAYGLVVKATNKRTKKRVAIKHMQVDVVHQYPQVKILRELLITHFLDGKSVRQDGFQDSFTSLIEVFSPASEMKAKCIKNIFLVMPLVERDLNQMLSETDLGLSHVKVILYNILCSVNYLHTSNIVHRDLKPANILVNSYCQSRICDFGLARTLPESIRGKHNGQTCKIRQSVRVKLDADASEATMNEQILTKLKKVKKLNRDATR